MLKDNEIPTSLPAWEAAGIQDARQARNNLDLICGHIGRDSFEQIIDPLIGSLGNAGDPDMALNHLERFLAELDPPSLFVTAVRERPATLTTMAALFGASRFLSTYAVSAANETFLFFSDPSYLSAPAEHEHLENRLSAMLKGLTQ